ncbi:hypothetical protein Ddye_016098 [Dipteronia dyeriana]|uniref:Uncharacterized protein n=1 Tax=Dipteronia dyeriana TaxID=168575 RepID=A0AAD9U6N8_9ROSI|nr:hypothetical protein Ddye_016098 [Dipteronia dyeriana]
MDATKLVIHHSRSWVGNCYEGGMTKWVNVPRCVSYDGLVKLVEDVAKVDVARFNLQLWSLAFTISGCGSIPTVDQSVCNDETIDDKENSQWSDTDNSDDSWILDIDRGCHDYEDCHDGEGCASGSVREHECGGPSGFATFNGVSFREDGLGDDVDQTFKNEVT